MKKNSFKEIFMKNKKAYISVFVGLFVVYALLLIGFNTKNDTKPGLPGENLGGSEAGLQNKGKAFTDARVTPEITFPVKRSSDNTTDNNKTDDNKAGNEYLENKTETKSEAAGSTDINVYDVVKTPDNTLPETTLPEVKEVSFDPNNGLAWPIVGEILMGFSMDHTVYYKTLSQYMTSDGLLIDAKPNDMIVACCDGIVSRVYTDTRHGQCVEFTAGNYTFTYGQLASVSVNEGDRVYEGIAVGMLGEPTKYYKEEGAHLYFKVCEDGVPVDPATLLRTEG